VKKRKLFLTVISTFLSDSAYLFLFFNICHVHLKILLEFSVILDFFGKNRTGRCTSIFTESGVHSNRALLSPFVFDVADVKKKVAANILHSNLCPLVKFFPSLFSLNSSVMISNHQTTISSGCKYFQPNFGAHSVTGPCVIVWNHSFHIPWI
jgi:hypothetical protein